MTPALTIAGTSPSVTALAQLAVLSLPSPHSRRAYAREIAQYLALGHVLTREHVQAYMVRLREQGKRPSSMNLALAAIRLLAREANVRGLLGDVELGAIERIKGMPVRGRKLGAWLELNEIQTLLDAAGAGANGVRNTALIACMVGCGLRRAEVCGLDWDQWSRRSGRWVWADVRGKGNRVRTVPCPSWAARYIEKWRKETTK